jgi:hypothetical protein
MPTIWTRTEYQPMDSSVAMNISALNHTLSFQFHHAVQAAINKRNGLLLGDPLKHLRLNDATLTGPPTSNTCVKHKVWLLHASFGPKESELKAGSEITEYKEDTDAACETMNSGHVVTLRKRQASEQRKKEQYPSCNVSPATTIGESTGLMTSSSCLPQPTEQR